MNTETNASNAQKIKSKLNSILQWFSDKWTPFKLKIIDSKLGVKYPKFAKIISNGWVVLGIICLAVSPTPSSNNSKIYEAYNNSKDYKSCISAARSAAIELSKADDLDVSTASSILRSQCGKEGATDTVESYRAMAVRANSPACREQMARAKQSCQGSHPSVYTTCMRGVAPACY